MTSGPQAIPPAAALLVRPGAFLASCHLNYWLAGLALLGLAVKSRPPAPNSPPKWRIVQSHKVSAHIALVIRPGRGSNVRSDIDSAMEGGQNFSTMKCRTRHAMA